MRKQTYFKTLCFNFPPVFLGRASLAFWMVVVTTPDSRVLSISSCFLSHGDHRKPPPTTPVKSNAHTHTHTHTRTLACTHTMHHWRNPRHVTTWSLLSRVYRLCVLCPETITIEPAIQMWSIIFNVYLFLTSFHNCTSNTWCLKKSSTRHVWQVKNESPQH